MKYFMDKNSNNRQSCAVEKSKTNKMDVNLFNEHYEYDNVNMFISNPLINRTNKNNNDELTDEEKLKLKQN